MSNTHATQAAPSIIYGTAFKDEDTKTLVETALRTGFRAIDTSGNRPQYREDLVGQGIAAAIASGIVRREDLFAQIQTKFSPHKAGKDPKLYPYDTSESIPNQVQQSVLSSLGNLGVDYIDCLILHSLYPNMADTITAWRAMEALVPSRVSSLGLSNVDAESLRQICEAGTIQPISVQNRFTGDTAVRPEANLPPGLPYPKISHDQDVRRLCHDRGITYVPWGLLWGNDDLLEHDPQQMLEKTANELGISKKAVWYACVQACGRCNVSVLCGTTKETTMRETLDGLANLGQMLEKSESHRKAWDVCVEYVATIVNSRWTEI